MPTLYHTTSFEAFLSIMSDTKSGYLSFRAYSPIGTSDNHDTQYLLEALHLYISDYSFYERIYSLFSPDAQESNNCLDHPFIICFSKIRNSDFIWKSFGDHNKGVAIGLNLSADLSDLAIVNGANLGIMKPKLLECAYWDTCRIKRTIVNDYPDFFHHNVLSFQQQRDLLQLAAMIKDPSYKHEEETRIIVWVANKKEVEFDEQRQRDYIIVRIPISCVKEIITGSCISTHDMREVESFKKMLFC